MLVGLISDTHGLLRPEVFRAFDGVEHILHAGDVGNEEILIELGAIAPVTAVWGNVDGFAVRARLPEVAELDLEGRRVTVVHGHRQPRPRAREMAGYFAESDLIVFGHSHLPEVERVGRTLAVNPGSAGPARFTDPVTVALAALGDHEIKVTRIDLIERR